MKKITIILLLSLYTISVVGYGVKGFYCCDTLTSLKVSFSDYVHHHAVQSTDKSDCCKEKYQYFKLKDNYVPSHYVNTSLQFVAQVPAIHQSYTPVLFVSPKINIANPCNAPPLYNGVSVFIANCTYLI
ncbi:MAG TPA: hypothetical protein VLS85_09640 [Hanamia sp.]|nr:hypothetical protein [Hanamia sp.]